MSFLRNVLHDLVEKRLWPFAVALLVALVAAPVVLGRSSGTSAGDAGSAGDVAAVTPAAPANAVPADQQVVTLVQSQGSGTPVHRGGKLLNPFKQHHQPKPAQPATTSGPSTPPPPSQTVTSAVSEAQQIVATLGGGGGGTPSGSSPTVTPPVPAPPAPAKDDLSTYRVSLKFGEDGAMKTYTDIPRLTPLPSADNPFFVFLGISADRKSAVFLVSSDAVPTGDGTCKPSVDDCSEITMQKHDLEYFDLQSGTAGVVQYQLEVTGIRQGKAKTAATAAKLRARESRAGREYLRQVMADEPQRLAGWSFSKQTGLLVDRPSAVKVPAAIASADADVAHVPAAVARAAVGQEPEGTATVMTVPVAPAQ